MYFVHGHTRLCQFTTNGGFYDGYIDDDGLGDDHPHDGGHQTDKRAEQNKDPSDKHYLDISNSSFITQPE